MFFVLRRALLLSLLLTLGGTLLHTAGVVQFAPPRQLGHRRAAVFFGDLAGRVAIEVDALRRRRQRAQIRRARGVPVQKYRQGALVEKARRTLLDVGLDAQLDGLRRGREKRRKELGQARCARGGREVGDGWRGRCGGLVRRIDGKTHSG